MEGTLRFVNVFAAAISAGTFLAVQAAVVPTVRLLPAKAGHLFHLRFDPKVDRFNPPLVGVAALTGFALLAVDWGDRAATALLAAGLIGSAVTGLVSALVCMPINHAVARWSNADVDETEWRRLRVRWNRFHLIRTIAALVALGCFLAAVLA